MGFWNGKRVLLTGASGFLGSYVRDLLRARGCDPTCPRKKDFDLTVQSEVRDLFRRTEPEIVMHLAASVGGIGANRANPGRFFYENAAMGIEVVHAAHLHRASKLVLVGTVCSYPKFAQVPFREESLWSGFPEETNAPYGVAKKVLLVQAQAYRKQYGLPFVYLIPVNLYGPRDNFDEETSHVVPAMVRKFTENRGSVTLWGTGRASREFLYVEDCAEALMLAAELHDGDEPVNLGTGNEILVSELAVKVASACGYSGEILWDPTKPDGQPRRRLDTSRATEAFGWRARTTLDEGIRKTVDWYTDNARRPA